MVMVTVSAGTFRAAVIKLLLLGVCTGLNGGDAWTALAAAQRLPETQQRSAIEAVLSDHPGFTPAHYNLGTLLISSDTTTAIRHLELAARSDDPTAAADAWYNLALARWKAGLLEEAVNAMTEAAKRNPAMASTRDEFRRAALARLDDARHAAEAEARKLRLNPQPLPPAHRDESYTAMVSALGGKPPYYFATVDAATVPAHLRFDRAGRLSGRATTEGTSSFAISITDSAQTTVSATVSVTVLPPPRITTTNLDEAVAGQPYRAALTASGLLKPRWDISGLPSGLTCANDTGVISGTPDGAGHFALTLAARDDERSASAAVMLTVADTFAPDVASLPAATAWAAYTATVTMRGPVGVYTFSPTATGGLRIGARGLINGTPDAPGIVELQPAITGPNGLQRHVSIPITVNPAPVIDEHEAIKSPRGQALNRAVRYHGGTPPLRWRLSDGTLPAGVRLDPDGTLRGAPSAVGSVTVTVELTDRWQAQTRQPIAITIDPPSDPPKQDKKGQEKEQKDQDHQDQNKPDQPNPDPKSHDRKSQAQKNQEQKNQEQNNENNNKEAGKNNDQPAPAEAKKGDSDKGAPEKTAQQQSAALRAAAAERFLDQIPESDKAALRQLLLGGTAQPPANDHPW